MARIVCILHQFPQLSESYAQTELRALARHHSVEVVSLRPPDVPSRSDLRVHQIDAVDAVLDQVRRFDPDVIHTHWLGTQLDAVVHVARRLCRPFTVRAHSFDVLWPRPARRGWRRLVPAPDVSSEIARHLDVLRSGLCLGVLCFPFARKRLARAGIPEHKLVPAWPVCDYARFHDESPNGRAIYNGGACLPKKDFGAYLQLARSMPTRQWNLYPIGYTYADLEALNERLGGPARVCPPVPHAEMPALYKRHEWMVYTADPVIGTVGWPVSVAEAQASGVGVCVPNLRPDLAEYVGPAGFVYDSFDELREILSAPYPETMRRAGFAHARRSDVHESLERLTGLWRAAGA